MKPQALVLERKILGVLIRAAREKAHRDIRQVAQRLGITPARARQYEMGTRDISLPELEILALFFRMPISFFLSGESTIDESVPVPPTTAEMRARRALIGARLKQARLAAGKSVEAASGAVDKTTVMYGRYERGQTDIPITELDRLARLLGIPLDCFVGDGFGRNDGLAVMDLEAWARLPLDIRAFIVEPGNLPFLRMAMKIRDLPVERLKELGEIMLVVR